MDFTRATHINDKILIHLEYGQEYRLYGSTTEVTQFLSTGTLSLESRYYDNGEKRETLGKSLFSNSGNYLSVEIQRIPDRGTSDTGD